MNRQTDTTLDKQGALDRPPQFGPLALSTYMICIHRHDHLLNWNQMFAYLMVVNGQQTLTHETNGI